MADRIKNIDLESVTQIPEPPVARFLFADTRVAWVWLLVRLYVGYQWIITGWQKLTGGWVFSNNAGKELSTFIHWAVTQSSGKSPNVQNWYAWFLQHIVLPNAVVFSYLVAFGEFLVGLGLIVGCLTGIAAFFGLFLNLNYLLAGVVSTNPILGFLALFLILAWRIAGYWGVDRYLLPLLGTPWWSGGRKHKTATPKTQKPPDTNPHSSGSSRNPNMPLPT